MRKDGCFKNRMGGNELTPPSLPPSLPAYRRSVCSILPSGTLKTRITVPISDAVASSEPSREKARAASLFLWAAILLMRRRERTSWRRTTPTSCAG